MAIKRRINRGSGLIPDAEGAGIHPKQALEAVDSRGRLATRRE